MMKRWLLGITLLIFLFTACDDEDNGTRPLNEGAGAITAVTMADSIEKPQSGDYNWTLLEAEISDPDGLGDVDSVYFYSLKPNGTYANDGNPIVMVDNGQDFNYGEIFNGKQTYGDKEAGDGIYSFSLIVFNSSNPDLDTKPGNYIFTFFMRDKAGNLSDAVTDSIEVYQ